MGSGTVEPVRSLEAQRLVLDAFARALRNETHVLSRRSELLWQQLYNRVQWASSGRRLKG